MSLIFPRRRLWQPQGTVSVDRGSRHAHRLEFAYLGTSHRAGIDHAKSRHLTPLSGAGFGVSSGGMASLHSATSAAMTHTLSAANAESFRGDLTMAWAGVPLGAYTSDGVVFVGVTYGDGSGAPFTLMEVARAVSGDHVRVGVGSGVTYSLLDTNVGLSGLYGRPVVIVASNAAGSNVINLVVRSQTGTAVYSGTTNAGASSNPRPSTTGNRISVGGHPSATSRILNAATTGAFIWSRAMSAPQMVDVSRSLAEIYFSGSRVFQVALASAGVSTGSLGVTANGLALTGGETPPAPGNRTHFGSVDLGGSTRTHTFTVANSGSADLAVTDLNIPIGWTLTTALDSVIPVGESRSLPLRLDASIAGQKLGQVTITTDDPVTPSFNFTIKGWVLNACPSPFAYPTLPAPGAVETTIDLGGTDYDMIDGAAYLEGTYTDGTSTPTATLYDYAYYQDNYLVTGGVLYREDEGDTFPVKSTLTEGFEDVAALPDLITPTKGWTQLTLQEDAAPTGIEAITLGNLVIANGESEFITNRVEPDATRAHSGTQSLRVFCQGATGTTPITKASLASGLMHFTTGQHIWSEFWVYIEDGTPLGLIDFECSFFDESPGVRLLLNSSYVPRIQHKFNGNPDVDGTNPIPTDQWVKLRMHIGLNSTSGIVQLWVNDALEIDGTLQTHALDSAVIDRVQIGVTANAEAAAVLLYVDDVKFARSEAGLAEPLADTGAGGGTLFGALNAMQSHPRTNLYRRKRR